jgi:predicted DNA-binding protein
MATTKSGRPLIGRRVATTIYLDPPVADELKRLSEHTRVPQAAYLREAINDLLKKHARELRRAKR